MEGNIKIGLMGSASVGKTTTANKLHEITGIEVHKELESRLIKKLIKRGVIKNKGGFSPQQSKDYQNRALSIRERLSRKNSFISDRVAGELWVYHQIYCGHYSTNKELATFKERCLDVMKKYDYLFLFPFGQIPIEDNNYRNINGNYQRMIHTKIEEMLEDFELSYIQLRKAPLSKEERVEEVLSLIRR